MSSVAEEASSRISDGGGGEPSGVASSGNSVGASSGGRRGSLGESDDLSSSSYQSDGIAELTPNQRECKREFLKCVGKQVDRLLLAAATPAGAHQLPAIGANGGIKGPLFGNGTIHENGGTVANGHAGAKGVDQPSRGRSDNRRPSRSPRLRSPRESSQKRPNRSKDSGGGSGSPKRAKIEDNRSFFDENGMMRSGSKSKSNHGAHCAAEDVLGPPVDSAELRQLHALKRAVTEGVLHHEHLGIVKEGLQVNKGYHFTGPAQVVERKLLVATEKLWDIIHSKEEISVQELVDLFRNHFEKFWTKFGGDWQVVAGFGLNAEDVVLSYCQPKQTSEWCTVECTNSGLNVVLFRGSLGGGRHSPIGSKSPASKGDKNSPKGSLSPHPSKGAPSGEQSQSLMRAMIASGGSPGANPSPDASWAMGSVVMDYSGMGMGAAPAYAAQSVVMVPMQAWPQGA